MELVIVRHAQPAWANAAGRSTNDPPLTPVGQQQAERLAEWMAGADVHRRASMVWGGHGGSTGFDALSTSPACRARQTAAPVEAALQMTATVRPWLLELGMPAEWEGAPEGEVIKVLAELRRRPRDEWWDGPPGGESFRDFHTRVTSGVDRLLADHGVAAHPDHPDHLWTAADGGPRLLLFAHAGTNSVITSHLLGLEPQPWEWERFPCDHASITILRTRTIATGAIWALEYFSDVAHLPTDHVTA